MMMCRLIDLNSVNNDDDETTTVSSSEMSASSLSPKVSVESESVCMELWHACAGPLISLPKKGSSVVYFPQGHFEQLSDQSALQFDLPPQLFCRVLDVKLHAESPTDEVYAQVWLIPDSLMEQKWKEGDLGEVEEDYSESAKKSMTPHMFCKTLTASDTSTHGGFSVPRRAAEDCFPPLDYTQQRPSQVLVAKDLHGFEWNFRHIYRGQPRRHLLTTGWSAFVNRKKLVSGDAVLFLRGADGELRLGIRRATSVKTCSTFPAALQLNASSFTAIKNAISMRNSFNVCYSPRAGSSEFIVPYPKFAKSVSNSLSAGMRFKMRFETEDAAEKRYTGFIVRKSDIDPIRWPRSKWRCLLVRWDDMEVNRLNRVSPWEIEPSGSYSGHHNSLVTGTKRTRAGMSATSPEYPLPRVFPDGNGISGFEEGLRLQKVLQGQEIMGFNAPYHCTDSQNHRPPEMNCYSGMNNSSSTPAAGNCIPISQGGASNTSYAATANFGESLCVNNKVSQGQETFTNSAYGSGLLENRGMSSVIDGIQVSVPGKGWPIIHGYQTQTQTRLSSTPVSQMSSPASVLMFQQPRLGNASDNPASLLTDKSPPPGNFVSLYKDSCRLFGFPLTEGRNEAIMSSGHVPDILEGSFGTGEKGHQFYSRAAPVLSEVTGSSYAQVNDLYAVRDLLLDIAL